MTLNLFPDTPMPSWPVAKSPNFATRMQRSLSGREIRSQDYVLPLYSFSLTWEILRDKWDIRAGIGKGPAYPGGTPYDEWRTILSFYLQQQGATIPFMYNDPADNTSRAVAATPQTAFFAVGDGVTTVFQMASALLAPVIPQTINSVTPAISFSTDPDTGLITFGSAPGNGVAIGADFTYYYKVRFAKDSLQGENFLYQQWGIKTLEFVSVFGDPVGAGAAQVIFGAPSISFASPSPDIPDTTPVGTTVTTFSIFLTSGGIYTGTPTFGPPNFDDSGHFIITGPGSGPGPYSLVLNMPLPAPTSIENVTILP